MQEAGGPGGRGHFEGRFYLCRGGRETGEWVQPQAMQLNVESLTLQKTGFIWHLIAELRLGYFKKDKNKKK